MEGQLVRQSGILFGEAMTRRIEERAAETSDAAVAAAPEAPAEALPDRQGSAEAASDNVAPMMKLNMTSRQQRRLWRHIGSIENFWETLAELEPGVIQRLAGIATERRWEVIFLTKRPPTAGRTTPVTTQRWHTSTVMSHPSP